MIVHVLVVQKSRISQQNYQAEKTGPFRCRIPVQNCTMTEGEAQAAVDEQSPLDDAMIFFREVVEPTVAEFVERPDDRRRGCLACLCLASMADHYFHARPESREGWAICDAVGPSPARKSCSRARTATPGFYRIWSKPPWLSGATDW